MKALGIVVLLALGGALAQGVVALARSDALRLEEFEVSGNQRVAKESIVEVADVDLGESLLTISTSQVTERLQTIPWIRNARVERILPSKLRILVIERTARAVLRTEAGPYLVDKDGLVLAAGEEPLLQIWDIPVREPSVGSQVDHPAFQHAWEAYWSMPEEIARRIVSISALTVDQVKFNLNDGQVVFYGAAEQLEDKNRAIWLLLQEQESLVRGSIIDVRVPSRPVLRSP